MVSVTSGRQPPAPTFTALMPTRRYDAANPGASYLAAAGFTVVPLVNHSSIFAAYSHGVARLQPADDDVVVLVHDDVEFDGDPGALRQTLHRHVALAGVGFVGVAGTRSLSSELVWWRNATSPTTLAGMVYHGHERSFFGPFGRVVVLDGVFLAATGRTLRAIRLDSPASLGGWHFYDISYTLQAHVAGLANLALPLGLRHASKGRTNDAWEGARVVLAHRLRPLLPMSVPSSFAALATAAAQRRRYAVLLPGAEEAAETMLQGGGHALADAVSRAGYHVVRAELPSGGGSGTSGTSGTGTKQPHAWRVVDKLVDANAAHPGGAVADDAQLLLLSGSALLLTPSADVATLLDAALEPLHTSPPPPNDAPPNDAPPGFVAPVGCTASTGDAAGAERKRAAATAVSPDVGTYLHTAQDEGTTADGATSTATATATPTATLADRAMAASGSGTPRLQDRFTLQTLAPSSPVASLARCGMLAGSAASFRAAHALLRSERCASLRAALAADGAAERLPFEVVYSALGLATGRRSAVVPLMPIHLPTLPMRCGLDESVAAAAAARSLSTCVTGH